jgi:hypothetical protein
MVVGFATTTEFEPRSLQGVLDTTLCDKVCQWLWFSPDTPVSGSNKIDRHDKTEILLKMALITIIPPLPPEQSKFNTYIFAIYYHLRHDSLIIPTVFV